MSFAGIRRFGRDTVGASAVEFALIAGPLLVLLLGSIEFGRIYWANQVLQETAIAGARCMGVPQAACTSNGAYDAQQSVTYIRAMAQQRGILVPAANVTINHATSCAGVSGFSSVALRYTFESALPHFVTMLAGGKTLTASACFPNQGT